MIAKNLKGNQICPVFSVSNKDGVGLDTLKLFISMIKDRNKKNKLIKKSTDKTYFDVNESFMVPGHGIVVSGVLKAGILKTGMLCKIGPDKENKFRDIVVKCLH